MGWGDWANLAVQAYGAYSSSKAQKDAAKDAGKATQQGTDASNKLIWDMFQQNRADQKPFYDRGVQALDQFSQMMGLGPSDPGAAYLAANPDVAAHGSFTNNPYAHYRDYGQAEGRKWGAPAQSQAQAFETFRNQPGYQFGMDQGLKAVQSSAAARGGLNSGATLKSLFKFGNDYADQQGFTPYMNRLSGLFGGAQTAAGQMGGYGQNAASQMGNNTMNNAYMRGQSMYDRADATSYMWGQGTKAFGNFMGAYNQRKEGGG